MQEETGARGGGTDGGAPCAHGIRIQHSGVPGACLCGDAAGGGGAALEAVVLDRVDVLLDVWPEVLGNTERRRQRKAPITITAHGGGDGRGGEHVGGHSPETSARRRRLRGSCRLWRARHLRGLACSELCAHARAPREKGSSRLRPRRWCLGFGTRGRTEAEEREREKARERDRGRTLMHAGSRHPFGWR